MMSGWLGLWDALRAWLSLEYRCNGELTVELEVFWDRYIAAPFPSPQIVCRQYQNNVAVFCWNSSVKPRANLVRLFHRHCNQVLYGIISIGLVKTTDSQGDLTNISALTSAVVVARPGAQWCPLRCCWPPRKWGSSVRTEEQTWRLPGKGRVLRHDSPPRHRSQTGRDKRVFEFRMINDSLTEWPNKKEKDIN